MKASKSRPVAFRTFVGIALVSFGQVGGVGQPGGAREKRFCGVNANRDVPNLRDVLTVI
jgi:hypothetical protein